MRFESNNKFPNQILRFNDDTYISYNPNAGDSLVGALCAEILTTIKGEYHSKKSEETAIRANSKWYILNGDFRKEYEGLAHLGIQACIDFFYSQPEHKSNWSTCDFEKTNV